jgi:hypothetical protein
MFNNSIDPSLQRLAVAIIKLFFYLRVKFLDLRKVGRLFSQRNTKYKTMLRKLYTVATGLELTGIIQKTRVVSEIQLVAPLEGDHDVIQLGLGSILNTKEELEEEHACARRRQEFEEVCTELSGGMARRCSLPPFMITHCD